MCSSLIDLPIRYWTGGNITGSPFGKVDDPDRNRRKATRFWIDGFWVHISDLSQGSREPAEPARRPGILFERFA